MLYKKANNKIDLKLITLNLTPYNNAGPISFLTPAANKATITVHNYLATPNAATFYIGGANVEARGDAVSPRLGRFDSGTGLFDISYQTITNQCLRVHGFDSMYFRADLDTFFNFLTNEPPESTHVAIPTVFIVGSPAYDTALQATTPKSGVFMVFVRTIVPLQNPTN